MAIQIPLNLPMLNKEMQSHMYSVSSFFCACILASFLSFGLYPLIVSPISFWMYGLDQSQFVPFLYWTATLTLEAICGFAFGLMIGTITRHQNGAISTNLLFAMILSFGGGMYANTGSDANPLIRGLTYISPIRFAAELLLRAVLKEKGIGGDMVLHYFGYTWGV